MRSTGARTRGTAFKTGVMISGRAFRPGAIAIRDDLYAPEQAIARITLLTTSLTIPEMWLDER